MVRATLAIGLLTKLAGKGSSFMLKEIFMMASGTWTEPPVMEFISIRMEHYIKGNGEMICNMAMAMKNG